jgi:hypothetical protein
VKKLQNIANQNKGKSLKIKEQSISRNDLGLGILTKSRTKLETNRMGDLLGSPKLFSS